MKSGWMSWVRTAAAGLCVASAWATDDVLTRDTTGVTGNSYTDWTATGASGAEYAGNSAGGNDSIQLRSTYGIVITKSSGIDVSSVMVEWNENTADAPTPSTVTIAAGILNGTVTADKETALPGEIVTLAATPATGYKVKAFLIDGVEIEGNRFTMPAKDVLVSATFVERSNALFEKITTVDQLEAGEYVITGADSVEENEEYAMKAELWGTFPHFIARQETAVVFEDGAISDPDESIVWTLAQTNGGWTIYNAAAGYVGYVASGNSAGFDETTIYLRFKGATESADNNVVLQLNIQSEGINLFVHQGDIVNGYQVVSYDPNGEDGPAIVLRRVADGHEVRLVRGKPVSDPQPASSEKSSWSISESDDVGLFAVVNIADHTRNLRYGSVLPGFACYAPTTSGNLSGKALAFYKKTPKTWAYSVSNNQATITSAPTNSIVIVPSSLGGYPVTSIEGKWTNQISLTIPNSVTNIGRNVLRYNTVTSLTIDMRDIPSSVFNSCKNLETLNLGNSVTNIGDSAFYGCYGLSSLSIGDNVANIGNYAFSDCTNLTAIVIPDGVRTIGSSAFSGCSGLSTLVLGSNLALIGASAFSSCTNLSSLTIPDSVANIGNQAFYGCRSLTELTVGNGVTNVGYSAFYDCPKLSTLNIDMPNIPSVFNSCKSLATLNLGNSVTNIGDSAFYGCYGLSSLSIGDNVANIGDGAFRYCTNLTAIVIPDGVTNIGNSAFYACNSSTELTIPGSVATIGSSAFYGWNRMTSLSLGNGVTEIGASAFSGCSNVTSLAIPNSTTRLGSSAFYGCSSLTSLSLGNKVEFIGNSAFYGCRELVLLTIPDSVTDIGDRAFYNCRWLDLLTIGNNVTNIGASAFYGCEELSSLVIPDSVRTIGSSAFSGCSWLQTLAIGDGLAEIGEKAFSGCGRMVALTIGNGVTNIGNYAFSGCAMLPSVTIPDNVASIGDYAFENGQSLTTIVIGEGVESIGRYAFKSCGQLSTLKLPDSVKDIGKHAFYGCDSLKTLYVPEALESQEMNGLPWNEYASVPEGCEIIYRPPAETYTVRFYANGGTGTMGDQTFRIGEEQALSLCQFQREQHLFLGWSRTNNDEVAFADGETVLDLTDKPGTTVLLYAVWRKIEEPWVFPEARSEEEVASVLAEAADQRLSERIQTVEEYDAFRQWAASIKDGSLGGAKAVLASAHAWPSYLLGAEELFENEPVIVLGSGTEAGARGARAIGGGVFEVSVTVKDGDKTVAVDAEKVAGLFECTGDLGDWRGEASLETTVEQKGAEGNVLRFEVTPGDGTATRAFLRIGK